MTTYVYRCSSCDLPDVEVRHSMFDDTPVLCECGAERHRVPQAAGVVLKGSGFYNTDRDGRAKGDADKGIPPARPIEFGGTLDTRKKK